MPCAMSRICCLNPPVNESTIHAWNSAVSFKIDKVRNVRYWYVDEIDFSDFKKQNDNLYLNPKIDHVRCSFISQGNRSQDSLVGIVNMLRAGRSGFRLPLLARNFSHLRKVQTGPGAQLAFYSVGTGGFFRWVKWSGREVIFHLAPRLRMNGATPLLHLYDLMTCSGKT